MRPPILVVGNILILYGLYLCSSMDQNSTWYCPMYDIWFPHLTYFIQIVYRLGYKQLWMLDEVIFVMTQGTLIVASTWVTTSIAVKTDPQRVYESIAEKDAIAIRGTHDQKLLTKHKVCLQFFVLGSNCLSCITCITKCHTTPVAFPRVVIFKHYVDKIYYA